MNLETRLVNLVSALAPWLAPLPTAWLVYDRAQRFLTWPAWIAAIAGLTLELLGVGILATALMLWTYNAGKRKSDPEAGMRLPLALVALYFITAELLTAALDVWPFLSDYAAALFPLLSVAAFVLLALRAEHGRRLADIEAQKAESRRNRAERKAERVQKVEQDAIAMQPDESLTKMDAVRWWRDLHPEWSNKELAQRVGCAPSTVTRALARDGNDDRSA